MDFKFFIIFFTCVFILTPVNAARIFIDPPYTYDTSLSPGTEFSVNINVSAVDNLYGFEFKLYWDSNILEYKGNTTYPEKLWESEWLPWKYEVGEGYYYLAYSGKRPILVGYSGSVNLVTITFRVKDWGLSLLELRLSKWSDNASSYIPHSIENASFWNTRVVLKSPINTDYYKDYIPLKYMIYGQATWIGYSMDDMPYVDITDTKMDKELWTVGEKNLTRVPDGPHNIVVSAKDNGNTYHSTRVYFFYCLGDVNNDKNIDIMDIAIIAKAFGSYPGYPNWNPTADINDDEKVDILDVAIVAKQFGKNCEVRLGLIDSLIKFFKGLFG